MKNNKIAIFGASGYIASYLIECLSNNSPLLLITNRPENIPEEVKGRCGIEVIKGDLGDEVVQSRIVTEKIKLIINLYGQTDIYFAQKFIEFDFEMNVSKIIKFFSYLVKRKFSVRFVQVGTVTQAGLTPFELVDEEFPDKPITNFDLHKLIAETYVQNMNGKFGFETLCVRLPNVFGGAARQFSGNRGVINRVILAAKKEGEIFIFGSGQYVRSYIDVIDVTGCIERLISLKNFPGGEMVIISNGKSFPLIDVWNKIAKIVSEEFMIDVVVTQCKWPEGTSPIEKRNFFPKNTKLMDLIGNYKFQSLDETLKSTILSSEGLSN
jgi:UDP-glucose 4-epimerase